MITVFLEKNKLLTFEQQPDSSLLFFAETFWSFVSQLY